MIRGLKPPVGWSEEYLQCVAIVAHYHRGGLPPSNHPIFAGLPAQRRSELMPLAGVLRLANALDDSHDQRISNVMVERRDGVLRIYAQGLTGTINPFGEQLARARYLLEACIKMPIMLRPLPVRRRTKHARIHNCSADHASRKTFVENRSGPKQAVPQPKSEGTRSPTCSLWPRDTPLYMATRNALTGREVTAGDGLLRGFRRSGGFCERRPAGSGRLALRRQRIISVARAHQ